MTRECPLADATAGRTSGSSLPVSWVAVAKGRAGGTGSWAVARAPEAKISAATSMAGTDVMNRRIKRLPGTCDFFMARWAAGSAGSRTLSKIVGKGWFEIHPKVAPGMALAGRCPKAGLADGQ